MNLLEHFNLKLSGPKKGLAIQLLNSPWRVDLEALQRLVPSALYRRFVSLRRDISMRLDRMAGKRLPVFWVGVHNVAVKQHSTQTDEKLIASGNDWHWIDQIWSQIVEDFEEEGRAIDLLNECDRAAFILFYSVAHACFFSLTGVHQLTYHGKHGLALAPNLDVEEAHRLYWFAHYLSSQSMLSDHLLIHSLIESANKAGRPMHVAFRASSDALAFCRNNFTDKFLSLHIDYLHLLHKKDLAAMEAMTKQLDLIVHIYLCSVHKQLEAGAQNFSLRFDRLLPVEIHMEDLHLAGFSEKAVDTLVEECMSLPQGDRFLVDIGGGRLQVGDISLKYAMQTHCHSSLSRMDSRGMWFEQDYIANYIQQRIPADRYRVFSGISDKQEQYDADLIIEDVRTKALFFCQVKHRTTTLLPHLRDEIKEYTGNSQIEHGLFQLNNLRSRIGSDGVLSRVKQRTSYRKLTAESLSERARYLLIHNIENLDFCTRGGIAMYEWNTLRNLMRGTMSAVAKGGVSFASISADRLMLEDPHQVMRSIFEWIEASLPAGQKARLSANWEALKASRLMFQARRSLHLIGVPTLTWKTSGFSFPVI
jgi:hypothetical protein